MAAFVTLDLQSSTINNGSVVNHSVLEATGGGTSTISNVADPADATGEVFTNNGKLLVKDDGTTLILSNDTLENTFGSLSGKNGRVEVYARSSTSAAFVTLDLQSSTINNGSVVNHSVLEATGGGTSTISNVADPADATGEVFTNNGKLLVKDDGTTLILSNDTLENTFGSLSGKNGRVEVYARSSTSAAFVTLDLQSSTINNGSVVNHSVLEATGGGTSTISNVADPADATGEVFTNNGKLLVKDDGTTLILSNDTLENTFGSLSGKNGSIEVDANANLYLQTVTINSYDGSHPGIHGAIYNYGLIAATSGANYINGAAITNTGTIEVQAGSKLTIDPSTIENNGGTVEAVTGATLDLANVTIFGGLLTGGGTIETIGNGSESTFDGTTSEVTISSVTTVTVNNLTTLDLTGMIVNDGTLAAVGGTIDLENVDIQGGTLKTLSGGTIATQGTGSDSTLDGVTIALNTVVTASNQTTLYLTGSIANNGEIYAALGGTIDLESVTITGGTLGGTGTIKTFSGDSTFDGTGASGFTIASASTVTVTVGTTLTLDGTIYNESAIIVDTNVATGAQLEISGTVLLKGGGEVTLDASGYDKIVSNGAAATLENVDNTISGAGTIGDANLSLDNFGIIDANVTGGTLILNTSNPIVNETGAKLEATNGGTLYIESTITGSGIFTFNSDSTGTLKFDPSTHNFSETIAGLVVGDTIDLVNTNVTSVTIIGSTLTVYVTGGGTLTYAIDGALDGNGFAIGSDSQNGTNLVLEVKPTVTWAAAAPHSGVEGTAIPLGAISAAAAAGNHIYSLVISVIPDGAVLSDGTNSFTANSTNGFSVDVKNWNLSNLSVTPSNDTNFTLAVTVTDQDPQNNIGPSASTTETVTVLPPAPTVSPSTVSGVEGTAIALNLGITGTNGAAGDSNTLNSVTLTFTVPTGDTYTFTGGSGLNQTFTATGTAQTLTLTPAQLAGLAVKTANDSNVSLSVTATEKDALGDVGPASTPVTETVTVLPPAPTVSPSTVSGVEGTAIALNLGITGTNGAAGDSNTLNSVTLTFTVPTGDTYTFTGGSGLNQTFTATGTAQTLTLTPAQLAGLAVKTANDSNVSLSVTATEKDALGDVGPASTPVTETVTVLPPAPTVSPSTVSGVEGTAIALNLGITGTNGAAGDSNTLNSVTLTFTVPTGDTYKFTGGSGLNQTFTATGTAQTLTLTPAQLAGLAVKTANDSNVSLSVTATEKDALGDVGPASTPVTETVTVLPPAPTVSPSTVSGVEGTAIALNLGITGTNGAAGDSNTLNSVTLTFTVPTGDTYKFTGGSGLNQTFTATGTAQTLTLTPVQLAGLAVKTANDSNVSLSVTATEKDALGDVGPASTPVTETVTVLPPAPTVSPSTVSGVEGTAIALNIGITGTNGAAGDSNTLNSVTLTFTVPTGNTYKFTGGSGLNQTFTATGTAQTLTLTPAQFAGLSITTTHEGSVSLSVTATEKDAQGDVGPSSASKTERVNVSDPHSDPAGIAGEPINLALTDLSSDHIGAVTLTIAGIPSGWSLSEGTNNGDGSWTVQTADVAALSITSPNSFAGALVLHVTQSWTNADGTAGNAVVTDNVEVYPKGSPIFALSGADTLTGSSGADLFVFAQPIGNDTIYKFDATADRLDLIGFGNISSFSDVQVHTADDSEGNAVITLGNGETITLMGVHASSLTTSNFVFDQEPVMDNAGTMTVSDGAILPLGGTINNTGTIALNSAGNQTNLEILVHGATLQGGGHITLSASNGNVIFGGTADAILTNVDNIISGAGQLGNGQLTIVNETAGVIDGNASGYVLVLDTGSNAVMNYGTIEASDGGKVEIRSNIINAGILEVGAGSTILIDNSVANSGTMETSGTLDVLGAVSGTGVIKIDSGANLEFGSASSATVTFANGSATTGNLVFDDSKDFTGQIVGFAGDGTTANSDLIDLKDINFSHLTQETYTENSAGTSGTLTLSDGTHTANVIFAGSYVLENFTLSNDGSGGILIIDGPAPSAPPVAATVNPPAPTVTPVAATGVEGSAIALDLGVTVNSLSGDSSSLATLVVSAIPVGAVLSDGTNTFTATAGATSVDVHTWTLSGLTITPPNATDFALTIAATEKDAAGNLSATTTSTEAVTVNPLAPTVTPVAATGVEGSAIALDLGVTVNSLSGDSSSLATLMLSAIPVGAVLSDGTNTFTATAGATSVDVHTWTLSGLTITPPNATDFALTIAATEKDAAGNLSATTTSTEAVTVNPLAPTVTPVAATGIEGSAIALDLGVTVNSLSGDSSSLATLMLSAIPVGAVLSDGTNSFTASAGATSVDVHAWTLLSLTVTPPDATNFTLTVAATEKDVAGNLSATTTSTEAVTVNPLAPSAPPVAATVNPPAPTVTPVAATGVEGSAIALDLGVTVNSLSSGSSILATLMVSAIPVGAVLSDGTNTFTATAGATSVDVHTWTLSGLTITPPNATDFALTIAATEKDAAGNLSATTTSTEAVTVNPLAPTVTPVAATGVEGSAIALDLGVTVNSLSGDSSSLATLMVSAIPVGGAKRWNNTFTARGATSLMFTWTLSV